ncbi:MAG: hypothetical protein R3290_01985 [Acidimicrobiia bacterium]|nr:hypothetical protein [Acidimicrobiia bacterium]
MTTAVGAVASLVRREPLVASFTAAHVVTMATLGTVWGRTFTWIYVPLLLASIAAVVFVDARFGPLPSSDLWLLSVWALAHMAGGLLGDPSGESDILYNWWIVDGVLKFDQVVHGYGIGVATVALVHAAERSDAARPLVVGALWAQGIGVGNEVVENVFAAFVDSSNVGDAVNTTWDLVWHLIGGAVAVVVLRWRRPARTPAA